MSIGPTNPLLLKGEAPSSTASPSAPPHLIGSAYGRPFFTRNAMTLRGALVAQLTVQAGWTCEARLAPAFPLSVLTRAPLADLLAHARILLNALWAFFYASVWIFF